MITNKKHKNVKYTNTLSGISVPKSDAVINVLGELDELNTFLGWAKTKTDKRDIRSSIKSLQLAVCNIASYIASAGKYSHGRRALVDDLLTLRVIHSNLKKHVFLQNKFVLPGENELSSILDIARSVSRRAERTVIRFFKKNHLPGSGDILMYMNMISSFLFMLARSTEKGRKK